MPDYSWPAPEKRRVIGRRTNRVDGFVKASGRAKYAYDIKRPECFTPRWWSALTRMRAFAALIRERCGKNEGRRRRSRL
jgi:CO/xanthine dehydrogenase Mo-binding subunit